MLHFLHCCINDDVQHVRYDFIARFGQCSTLFFAWNVTQIVSEAINTECLIVEARVPVINLKASALLDHGVSLLFVLV